MKLLVVFTVFGLAIATESELHPNGTSKNRTVEIGDRINLNLNYGVSHAYNSEGSSSSEALSFGMNTGLLFKNGHYQSLSSKTEAQANSYNSGRKPPSTYAHSGTNSQGQYGVKGNVSAGFSGGEGNVNSESDKIAIELPGGATILSNLHPINKTKAKSSEALVFSLQSLKF